MENNVILVDENDKEIGTMPKLEAHKKGLLHRAFSIVIWNEKEEMLIQKRAYGKYHSAGLWSNTCCSHPLPGEITEDAADRRLKEECNFNTPLEYRFNFIYKTELENQLTENELDHVFVGKYNHTPVPNTEEISELRWICMDDLIFEMNQYPDQFTYWFKKLALDYTNQISSQIKQSLPHESL